MADEDAPVSAPDSAAMRRRWMRWLTLGEIVAVAALVVSALTLWNNIEERRHSEVAQANQEKRADVKARTLVLRAKVEKDGSRLALSALGDQSIQGQTIRFPAALDVSPVDSTDPRIETSWFASGLKQARHDAGEEEKPRGDARLPIAIVTRYYADGEMAEDVSIYDLGYAVKSGFLLGSDIKLRGLSLIGHANAKDAQAKIDALWRARHPTPKP
jgi:hypothetical protein